MSVNIKTKFEIGDKVFIMSNNKITSVVIEQINISRGKVNKEITTTISYKFKWFVGNDNYFYSENAIFATKEELVNSLL